MKSLICLFGLGLSAAMGLCVAPAACAQDAIQVTPLAATAPAVPAANSSFATSDVVWSESSAVRSQSMAWGPAGGLMPEPEWKPYVTRPSAFIGSQAALDPARIPVLSLSGARTGARSQSAGTSRARSQSSSAAAKPVVRQAPADPCAEKVRQALAEAAKAGKIPASAVPPASTSGAVNQGARSAADPGVTTVQKGQNGQAQPAGTTHSSGQIVYPYDSGAANVAPGTAAQGASAPSPQLGAGAVPVKSVPFSAAGSGT